MSSISVVIATYGDSEWETLANERAARSLDGQGPGELITWHEDDGTRASSLNSGARVADGDWLIFLDADDELAPGYVGAMRRALESTEQAMAGLGTARRDVASQGTAWVPPLYTPSVQQIRKGRPGKPFFFPECSLETGNWLVIGTMISKRLFDQIGGFDEHPHGLEDFVLWAKAVKAGATIVKVPDAVYIAHVNPQSAHHRFQRNRREYMVAYEHARASVWG